MVTRDETRRAALGWLEARYPELPEPYDGEAAVDGAGLRSEGLTSADVLAWAMPGQQAAADYQRACQKLWGRRQVIFTDGDGQVVAATVLREEVP